MADERYRDDLEEQVREGLQRREPPAGFADRVMQRIADEPAVAPRLRAVSANVWRWVVAAMLLLAIGGGVLEQRQMEERRQQQIARAQARAQLMTALRITSAQLQQVNEQVNP